MSGFPRVDSGSGVFKPPPMTKSKSEPMIRLDPEPSPIKSSVKPKTLSSHESSIGRQSQLSSSEVPKKVLSRSSSMKSVHIEENATEHSSMLKTLKRSVSSPVIDTPPVTLSPKSFKKIEMLARAGKSPTEIAEVLKHPDTEGSERYETLTKEGLGALIEETPQYDRGHMLSENDGKPRFTPMRADVRLRKDVEKIETDIFNLEQDLETEPNGPDRIEMTLKLQKLRKELPIKQEALAKFLSMRDKVEPAPKHASMLKSTKSVFHKLYQQGTSKHSEAVDRLQDERAGLVRRLKSTQSQLIKIQKLSGIKIGDALVKAQTLAKKQKYLQSLEGNLQKAKIQKRLDPTALRKLSDEIRVLRTEVQGLQREVTQLQPLLDVHTKIEDIRGEIDHVDDELLELDEHSGMQWDSLKTEFLKTDRREFFMEAMTDFRMQFVNLTVKEVISDLKTKELTPLKEQLGKLESTIPRNEEAIALKKQEIKKVTESWDGVSLRAVGSTDLTSDYDMTIEADRAGMDTAVMKEVNTRIQARYGIEAGSVFDTNLYVKGGAGPEVAQEIEDGHPKIWESEEAHELHDEGMDIASLVKQRKYSTQTEWNDFTSKLRVQLTAKLGKVAPPLSEMEISRRVDKQMKRFDDANTKFLEVDHAIKSKMEELKLEPEHADKNRFELELTAMNRLYEAYSETADVLKKEWESMSDGPEKDLKWAAYTRADTEAQFFANEPYFSEGPIRDVVINGQKLKGLETVDTEQGKKILFRPKTKSEKLQKIDISPIQALQSLTENYGDSMKEFEHLKDKPLGDVAIKASKYMGRLARAIQAGIPEDQMSGTFKDKLNTLQKAEVELLRIRKGGKIPSDFVATDESKRSHEYGMKVLQDSGLGDITELDDLVQLFKEVKMEADVIIRSSLT